MVTKDKSDVNNEEDAAIGHNNISGSSKHFSKKISKSIVAGILLIIAGMISIVALVPYLTIDDAAIDDLRENDDDFNKYAENKTNEEIKNEYVSSGTMGIIISFFPILGGIFALVKKGWLISLVGGLIGILFSAVVISIILALIAFLLIIFSKKEFQQNLDLGLFKKKKEY